MDGAPKIMNPLATSHFAQWIQWPCTWNHFCITHFFTFTVLTSGEVCHTEDGVGEGTKHEHFPNSHLLSVTTLHQLQESTVCITMISAYAP
jgi:hypothetical protein